MKHATHGMTLVFDGLADQYKEHPIPVATGPAFVLNADPDEDGAFPIVGQGTLGLLKAGDGEPGR